MTSGIARSRVSDSSSESVGPALPYRPDIDGLRAVAVSIVVLFHAKLGILSGGFVGVDVFFVISGYLIASIIVAERHATGRFSYVRFYERRLRRILPALTIVVAAATAAGAFLYPPSDFVRLARSASATMLFFSNFFFSRTVGYFMPAAEKLPLLHTWSLGVEEQFYLVAPLFILALVGPFHRWRRWPFLMAFVLSFGMSIWGVWQQNAKAFFLPQYRVFELLIGVALAIGIVPDLGSRRRRDAGGLLGLGLIAVSAFGFSLPMPFPGLAAAVPCLGAALVIHSGRAGGTLVTRLLSIRPVVFTGRISYSLYLWHWPLFAFAAYGLAQSPSLSTRLGLVAAAYGLAMATYVLVEQPARRNKSIVSTWRVFAASAAALLAAYVGFGAIERSGGWPSRLPAAVIDFEKTSYGPVGQAPRCDMAVPTDCEIGALAPTPASFVLFGDSHAGAIAPMLSDYAAHNGLRGYFLTEPGCAPLLDDTFMQPFGNEKCVANADRLMRRLAGGGIQTVFVVARWALYSDGSGFGEEMQALGIRLMPGTLADTRASFAAAFLGTLHKLVKTGVRVVVIGPVPELGLDLPTAMTKAILWNQPFHFALDVADFQQRQEAVLLLLEKAAAMPGVTVVYPHRILCHEAICDAVENGHPLYFDDDHLNGYGAARIIPLFQPALSR